jgi:hypothetical protein
MLKLYDFFRPCWSFDQQASMSSNYYFLPQATLALYIALLLLNTHESIR